MTNNINIENILPLVQKPVRYINHEWNAAKKKHSEGDVAAVLCFPDLYEVGASNLGLEILYHIVNENRSAYCERAYLPARDMENIMREKKLPLFSLESAKPLKSFDILGITLQYELCAANVLNMIDLSGIPIFSKDRDESHPLILGGGPMTINPEPVADFFDAFVLGDGEDAINEIIEIVRAGKAQKLKKSDLLKNLSKLEGVYVPSLYGVEYESDGTIKSIKPNLAGVPEKITKRTVNLDASFFPSKKLVPYMETVHNRINIEIARGCPRLCRFCSASKYYWPWRIRKKDNILKLAAENVASTGYGEVSFSSLSCTDYKNIDGILSDFNRDFGARRINISLPSLRCDKFSLEVAKNLDHNKKTNLTFAPEAGTQRLRNVIGKYLSDENIIDTIGLASVMGWQSVKLYFMVGLPTENEADIEGIKSLVWSIKRRSNRLNFNVSVAPFVPKAQTAFQWAAMGKEETLKDRIVKLKKTLPASIKGAYVEPSVIEAAVARGDRRLAKVIYRVWTKGARFDQWKEQFNFDLWKEAFKEENLDIGFYIYRERKEDEVFPWDHLVFGAEKSKLLEDYKKALIEDGSKPEDEPERCAIPAFYKKEHLAEEKAAQRVRLRFERHGILRFLSHLEQIELFRNTLRRSGLPVIYTSGFSPQPKASFGPAISVGYESESEYMEVSLFKNIDLKEIEAKIRMSLPQGYGLREAKKVPIFFPSFDSLVNVAVYNIKFDVSPEMVNEFISGKEIIAEKKKGDIVKKIDVKPLIKKISAENGYIHLELRFGPQNSVKAEKIIQLLCSLDENSAKMLPVNRTGFLIEKKDGTVIEP